MMIVPLSLKILDTNCKIQHKLLPKSLVGSLLCICTWDCTCWTPSWRAWVFLSRKRTCCRMFGVCLWRLVRDKKSRNDAILNRVIKRPIFTELRRLCFLVGYSVFQLFLSRTRATYGLAASLLRSSSLRSASPHLFNALTMISPVGK